MSEETPPEMSDDEFKELLNGKTWEELLSQPVRVYNKALTNREIAEIYRRANERQDHNG
jgi:hypothetical protein